MTVLISGQGYLKLIMYSIYINNLSGVAAYVRLSSEKMQYSDSYVQKIKEEILDKAEGKERTKEYTSFLALGGFCFISPGGTLPFPVENAATSLYVSVVCVSTVWMVNFPFDPKMYGCISIKLSEYAFEGIKIILLPYNPKAVWLGAESGGKLPTDLIVEAGVGRSADELLYFGRVPSLDGGIPCAVTSSGNCRQWMVCGWGYEKGDLLKNTGFELLIRAKRGDPIPPNAVMTGVTEEDGSLFVGRVGGSIPCYITTKGGKIQCFVYGLDRERRVENGEVLVLTR